MPAGADTVIMVEDTRVVSTYEDGSGEEKEVETLALVPVGENVRNPGSDVKQGDLVLASGDRILSGGGEIGTLAFVGRKQVGHVSFVMYSESSLPRFRSKCTRSRSSPF